ncbi:MAG TPA: hypothetical protein DCQ04_14005 [Actinobacteria bacterium]|nr:hypothetical protein [Actinomycetota bacterium]
MDARENLIKTLCVLIGEPGQWRELLSSDYDLCFAANWQSPAGLNILLGKVVDAAVKNSQMDTLQAHVRSYCNRSHWDALEKAFVAFHPVLALERERNALILDISARMGRNEQIDLSIIKRLEAVRREMHRPIWQPDEYECIGKQIGAGGFAWVSMGRHRLTGQMAVIRVLHPHHQSDRSKRERFLFGAWIMGLLKHPHIAELYSVDERSASCVLKYYPNGTLYDAVINGTVSATSALKSILDIGSALMEAHRLGIVHRDVKPDNILLGENNQAVLIDFDLSFMVSDSDRRQSQFSTRYYSGIYSAPEMAAPEQPTTISADIYSLAMTAMFCISGAPLSMAAERGEVLQEMGLSPELRDLFMSAIAADPAERPESMHEFCTRLRQATEQVDLQRHRNATVLSRAAREELRTVRSGIQHTQRTVVAGPWTRLGLVGERGGQLFMGVHPVTNFEFRHFLGVKGYSRAGRDRWWTEDGREFWDAYVARIPHPAAFMKQIRLESDPIDRPRDWDHRLRSHPLQPVGGVCWYEAEGYCTWLYEWLVESNGFKDVLAVRLPSLKEWLAGAGYEPGLRFPWGNSPADRSRAACLDPSATDAGASSVLYPELIGQRPGGRSPAGCHDMIGNIWEWVEWPGSPLQKLMCGGCIHDWAKDLIFSDALVAEPYSEAVNVSKGFIQQRFAGYRHPAIGFRVVVERKVSEDEAT